MKIKPLSGYVLIKQLDEETRSESGIIIPEIAKEKPQKGLVVEVGDEIAEQIKIGCKVIFKKWGGHELRHEGEDVILIEEEEILATYEEEK